METQITIIGLTWTLILTTIACCGPASHPVTLQFQQMSSASVNFFGNQETLPEPGRVCRVPRAIGALLPLCWQDQENGKTSGNKK